MVYKLNCMNILMQPKYNYNKYNKTLVRIKQIFLAFEYLSIYIQFNNRNILLWTQRMIMAPWHKMIRILKYIIKT